MKMSKEAGEEYKSDTASGGHYLPEMYWETFLKLKNIENLYEWQKDCLQLPAIRERKNVVCSLPTGGGKTMIAEILIIRELLVHCKNAVFILPFRAIVQEKICSLAPIGMKLGFLIEEYSGNKGLYPPIKRKKKKSVYVSTIEKSLGLIDCLIEENRISEIGLVIIDELHFIGEEGRGGLLENVILKLLCFPDTIQIFSMSATIGNLEEIKCFMNAEIYQKDFKATDLKEYVKVKEELYLVEHKEDQTFLNLENINRENATKDKVDIDGIGTLVNEVVPTNSCLVFCSSKLNCENVATMICKSLDRINRVKFLEEKKALIKALCSEGTGFMCVVLKKSIPFGVAYHHSGLTNAERKLIEEAFLAGTLTCICCTSTLAAGINLPAQRVIIRSPYVGKSFITLSKYRQMIGRAGRAGMASHGESFLICQPSEAQKVNMLLSSNLEDSVSQLHKEQFPGFLMSLISLKLADDFNSMLAILRKSLLFIQSCIITDVVELVHKTVGVLVSQGIIEVRNGTFRLQEFGFATVKANLSFEAATCLCDDLREAQNSLMLLNELHLLYLITPSSAYETFNVSHEVLWNTLTKIDEKSLKVARRLGISDSMISRIITCFHTKNMPLKLLKRFFVSLILLELWNGRNEWLVSRQFEVSRGFLNNLLSSTSSYASSVTRFCEVFSEFSCFVGLFSQFPQRLSYCCCPNFFPLMDLPGVNMGRARLLFNAGFTDLKKIAQSDPMTLSNLVHYLPSKHAQKIIEGAKLLLLVSYETLQEEMENLKCSIVNEILPSN